MSGDEITLRAGRPEFDDGRLFAGYLDVAADGAFELMIGRGFAAVIAEAYLEPGHDLSFEHVTFAERSGTVVGMASAYTGAEHRASTDEPLERAAGWWGRTRLAFSYFVGRPVFRFLGEVPDTDYYLQAVAVDPSQRGGGVGSALIARAEADGRAAGCTRLALDVDSGNDGARRLYERLGMHLEATSDRVPWLPGIRVHRMVEDL